MSENYELRNTDSFIAAAIGAPGERIFFLQGIDGDQVVTLKLEKTQVEALASALSQLLAENGLVESPAQLLALREPVSAAWTVAELGAGIDEGTSLVVVVAREMSDADIDDELELEGSDEVPTPATALFHLRPELVTAFCAQAIELVGDGRDFAKRNGYKPMDL